MCDYPGCQVERVHEIKEGSTLPSKFKRLCTEHDYAEWEKKNSWRWAEL